MTDLIPRNLFEFPAMNRVFRDFFEDPFFKGTLTQGWADEGSLAVDISEGKEGDIIVRSSLPGFRKEDVSVTVHNNVLSIKAESKDEKETQNEKYYRKERRWGSVSRSVALPGQISEDNVRAELKDGVLTVKLLPAKAAQSKRIEVK